MSSAIMDHIKFRKISVQDQLEVIKYHGVMLMDYTSGDLVLQLYSLEGFYVEILRQAGRGEIQTITSYPCIEGLEHFLSRIDIYMPNDPQI
jgi:hypothetical protein